MTGTTVTPRGASQIDALLDSPEITVLIADLQETRWTGRPGFPLRAMVGMVLVKSVYALPTWTRTARLVAEHRGLQRAIGVQVNRVPSVYACYRFTAKLRQFPELLDVCIAATLASLHDEMPDMGTVVAIDGSDMPAYANGQRFVSKGGKLRERFSDPDASWGHRSSISTRSGGGYYGYKVHAAVCTTTGLPLAWEVRTAKDAEAPTVPGLLDRLVANGFAPEYAVLDKGYDVGPVYDACAERDIRPIIPLRQTPAVKAGKDQAPRVRARDVDVRRVRRQA